MSDVKSSMIVFFCTLLLSMPSILPAGTVQYHYDAAGQLTGATYDNGTQYIYTYDNAGNRVTKTVTLGDVCLGDQNGDQDVDGLDLASFAAGGAGITLEAFAQDFGKTNCPQ